MRSEIREISSVKPENSAEFLVRLGEKSLYLHVGREGKSWHGGRWFWVRDGIPVIVDPLDPVCLYCVPVRSKLTASSEPICG